MLQNGSILQNDQQGRNQKRNFFFDCQFQDEKKFKYSLTKISHYVRSHERMETRLKENNSLLLEILPVTTKNNTAFHFNKNITERNCGLEIIAF